MESHMLPGVSPGKNTPIVTEFAGDADKIKKYDTFDTLRNDLSMTEKVKKLNEKYVLHVRPISFFSKSFTESGGLCDNGKRILCINFSSKQFS